MRRLSSEEIRQEQRAILDRPWPRGRTLPVKNLYDSRKGTIELDRDGLVVPDVVTDQTGETVAYESVLDMVEAGWVGD